MQMVVRQKWQQMGGLITRSELKEVEMSNCGEKKNFKVSLSKVWELFRIISR